MVKPSNTNAIAKATHRAWPEWVTLLDGNEANSLDHTAIAALALELMEPSAESPEWWAQSVAIAYEQHHGLRVPGQSSAGDFQVSTSRTLAGDMDEVLDRWQDLVSEHTEFDGVPVDGEASVSRTQKWRYWRVKLADDSRISVNISNKSADKAGIAVDHSKLAAAEDISRWRTFWKGLLSQL